MSITLDAPVVLIAEDDPDIRDLISWKLESAGYRTLHADNGRTALTLAHQHHPDAVVLDIGMPEMDGLAVCQHLHEFSGTTDIPVLMLTARVRDTDIALGFTVGADDYMTKPFNPQELIHRVGDLLTSSSPA